MANVCTINSAFLNLTANFQQLVTTGVIGGAQPYPQIISIAQQFVNTTGAALSCDLIYGAQITPAATPTVLDFSAINDPSGTSRNWTTGPGRVRFLIVQNLDTTAGHDLSIYKDATNGVAWLPASTSPNKCYANGGISILVYDPNGNGAGVGAVLSTSSKRFDIDPGANTVGPVNVIAIGDSVL